MRPKWKLVFSPFVDSANLDARLVHSLRRTYHMLKIISDAFDVLLGDEAQVEARFSPFGDSATPDAR